MKRARKLTNSSTPQTVDWHRRVQSCPSKRVTAETSVQHSEMLSSTYASNCSVSEPEQKAPGLNSSTAAVEVTLESEPNLLEGILQTSVAAIVVINLQGEIVFANEQVEAVLGLTKSQLIQSRPKASAWEITDFDGNPLPDDQLPFRQVIATGKPVFQGQYAITDTANSRKYLSVNGAPLKDGSGRLTGVVCSIIDVTKQWQADAVLQEQAELYHQMFETKGAMKLLIDLESGAIVDANQAACQFYGYPTEVLKCMNIGDLNISSAKHEFAKMQQTEAENQHYWVFQHRLASGELRDVEVYSSTLHLRGHKFLYSIIHDITDRNRIATTLRHQTEQERLVGVINQRIRQSLDVKEILQATATEVRQFLQVDRVLVYRLSAPSGSGSVVVESCSLDYPSLLGWEIGESSLDRQSYLPFPQSESMRAIADIHQSHLDPAYVQLLEVFEVKAQLLIPILLGEQLWGFLVAHQCKNTRPWQAEEIELLKRIEMQLAVAIQQAELYQRVRRFNADLEMQVQERTVQLQKALGFEAILKRITDKVRDSLDEAVILQAAVQELTQAFHALRCSTALYDLAQETATIYYEYTTRPLMVVPQVIKLADFPEIYAALLRGETLQFCMLPTPGQEAVVVLACPIVDNRRVLGNFWLVHSRDYCFKDREIRLVCQVANQCAIALRQSHLYQTAQEQVVELAKLNRLKDDFLSTISHELRTPLSSIKMSAQLIEILIKQGLQSTPSDQAPQGFSSKASVQTLNGSRATWTQKDSVDSASQDADTSPPEPVLPPKIEQCLRILREECDREIRLVGDLLTLQQLEAETQPITLMPIRLQDWIPQIAEPFEVTLHNHQQILKMNLPTSLPPLVTDASLFSRILTELLTNASKFTPAGEVISISARLKRDPPQLPIQSTSIQGLSGTIPTWVQVCVTNSGVEIPAQELRLIFDPFYRIPSNNPWKYGGTGLGLALVEKVVTYLGGSIWAESQSGQTSFTVEFPVEQSTRVERNVPKN